MPAMPSRGATAAAGDEVRLGKANLKADLADGALAGIAALEKAAPPPANRSTCCSTRAAT